MKAPKFTGMKKGYAAVFVATDNTANLNGERIRIFHCQDLSKEDLYNPNTTEPMNIEYTTVQAEIEEAEKVVKDPNYKLYKFQPCWLLDKSKSVKQQITAMNRYNKGYGFKSTFLGYVKEVE